MVYDFMNSLPNIIQEDKDIAHWEAWNKMSDQRREMLEKTEQIKEFIWMIENDDLRAFTYFIFSQSHPSMWEIPSSSSGKYHPEWENGEGGLIRHIKAVFALCMTALRRYGYSHESPGDANINAEMRDILAFSALLHDWGKNGDPNTNWGKHTTKTHGEDTAKLIKEELLPKFIKLFPEINNKEELENLVDKSCFAIQHHYGVWSKEKIKPDDEKLTNAARILQESDYYSSRKIFSSVDEEEIKKICADNSPVVIKRIG